MQKRDPLQDFVFKPLFLWQVKLLICTKANVCVGNSPHRKHMISRNQVEQGFVGSK